MRNADPRGRYFADSQYTFDDTPVGATRGFSRLWDGDGAQPRTGEPIDGWERGVIVRRSQPVFVLTALGPSLDAVGPAGWRPNI